MKYVSVCDGIGAAHVAWHPLGWRCLWTSEIEPFPIAVVDHHWKLPNLGDMLKITEADCGKFERPDVLIGGTPCQSFSVAGLRGGLADPRGNLALRFLQLAGVLRPQWVAWENVPGVLSSSTGRDFGTFLGGLAKLGYGFAYRVLDTQYFGVPQRRARVFVVGYLGDWRRAAQVLFERHSLSGHPAPRRQEGKGITRSVAPCLDASGVGFTRAGDIRRQDPVIAEVAPTLDAHFGEKYGYDNQHIDAGAGMFVTHALRGEGFDASEDGTGRGTPLIPFDTTQITSKANYSSPKAGDPCHPLARGAHPPAIAFQTRIARNGCGQPKEITDALTSSEGGTHADSKPHIAGPFVVRRLMPIECERLQAFPDNYTAIQFRGKPAADGPRYKALGNSMCVNVMRWIGKRLAKKLDRSRRFVIGEAVRVLAKQCGVK